MKGVCQMETIRLVLVLTLIAYPLTLVGQHSHAADIIGQVDSHLPLPASDLIDGAKTPNLVPDLTAWRLWLLSVTAEDSSRPELAEARRRAFLRSAGIPEIEIPLAEEGIAQFRKDYGALMDNYNKRLNGGENPSLLQFRAQRDALVQAIQNSLSGKLETTTVGKLRQHISSQKARMKVAREVQ